MSAFTAVNVPQGLLPDVCPAPQALPPDVGLANREDTQAEPDTASSSSCQPNNIEAPANPKPILHSGASKAVNDAFFTLYNTYLANHRPRTMQDSAKADIKRYDDGHLTAQQLADCMSAFYEAISDLHEASQEQAAWLSNVERQKDHWKKLGYLEYKHYLVAIDPHGKARNMIDVYQDTVRRKTNAVDTVHESWTGSPELLELVAENEGENKWRNLSSLAKATDRAPEVAKYCLNLAMLTRIRSGKTGRSATKSFISLDFMAAKRKAETVEWAARPWDKEEYEGISDLGMKLYRGVLMSKKRYPGKEDR